MPALNSKPIDFSKVEDPNKDKYLQKEIELEEFTEKNRTFGESLIPLIGLDNAQRIVSKRWQNREEALIYINSNLQAVLKKLPDINAGFSILISIIKYSIPDKIVQVYTQSLEIYNKLIKEFTSNKSIKLEPSNLEIIHVQILDRLVDAKLQNSSLSTYLEILKSSALDLNQSIIFLFKTYSYITPKMKTSTKHMAGRLELFKHILAQLPSFISQTRTTEAAFPFPALTTFLAQSINASDKKLRNKAQDLYVQIYAKYGFEKIEKSIQKINQNQIKQIGASIPEALSFLEQSGGSGSGVNVGGYRESAEKKGEKAKRMVSCQYCLKKDKRFSDDEGMNTHFYNECAMLNLCPLCELVVEIRKLDHHLVNQCEKKGGYKMCKNCKGAFKIKAGAFDKHVKTCQGTATGSKCPWCHGEIKGEKGWKVHLVDKGCPKNPRNKKR